MVMVPPANQGRSQLGQRFAPHQQAAQPGRIAEHLVEGEGDEIRMPPAQVEPVGRHEGGGIEQDIPAERLGFLDQRPADTARRKNWTGPERQRGYCPSRCRFGQLLAQPVTIEAQLRRRHRHVGDLRRPWLRANSRMPLTELWLS